MQPRTMKCTYSNILNCKGDNKFHNSVQGENEKDILSYESHLPGFYWKVMLNNPVIMDI